MEHSNSSAVDPSDEENLESLESIDPYSLVVDYLQNLPEEQWTRISDELYYPLTKQQLVDLSPRIVQFFKEIITPGLDILLDIQHTPISSRSASETGLNEDHTDTVCPVAAVSSRTSQSELLHVTLSEDTLISFVQDGLQRSLSKWMCIPSPGTSVPTMITPVVIEEVVEDVTLSISAALRSAYASQTSPVTPGRSRTSQTNVTDGLVEEPAGTFEKVDRERKRLRQIMSTISDTVVVFIDETEQSLLKDLTKKIDFVASQGGFTDDLDALIKKYENINKNSEAGTSCKLTSKIIQKISSQGFQTSATEVVAGVIDRKVQSLTLVSSAVRSELTGYVAESELVLSNVQSNPVSSAASVVVEAFVTDMKCLADPEESPQEISVWSAAVHTYHRIQKHLKDFFNKLQPFAQKNTVPSDEINTHDECNETVPCLDKKYQASKSETQFPESNDEVTLQRGLSENSKLHWAHVNSEENKRLFTTCTKEVISELLVLYNNEVSNEDHLSTTGQRGSDVCIERQQFVEAVLTQLGDIAHSREPSLDELLSQIKENIGCEAITYSTRPAGCMKNESIEKIERNATASTGKFLVNESTGSSTTHQPVYSVKATSSGSILNHSIVPMGTETFVEDLQDLPQTPEMEQRGSDQLENGQKLQNQILSATTGLCNNLKNFKCITICQKRSDLQSRISSHSAASERLLANLCTPGQELRQASTSTDVSSYVDMLVDRVLSQLKNRSPTPVEEGQTDTHLQSVSTPTSTNIIQNMVKDLQEIIPPTKSADLVSGTSPLTAEKIIWSVALTIYNNLQRKINEFLINDLQRLNMALGQSGAQSADLKFNQNRGTPQGKDPGMDIPYNLLPKINFPENVLVTTELLGPMLEVNGCQKTFSSHSISTTPSFRQSPSEWDFSLPDTASRTEIPARSSCRIVRNTMIEDLFYTEDLLPPRLVDKVKQAAGIVVDKMVASIQGKQGSVSSRPNTLKSAVWKWKSIISTGTVNYFIHEFVYKCIAIQNTSHVLSLMPASSASDPILLRLRWGEDRRCSTKLSYHLLHIFATESARGFLKHWLDDYEDVDPDDSLENKPCDFACMAIPNELRQSRPNDSDRINELTEVMVNTMMDAILAGSNPQVAAKCSLESVACMATRDRISLLLDLIKDETRKTGDHRPPFKAKKADAKLNVLPKPSKTNITPKVSKTVDQNNCPQGPLTNLVENSSQTVDLIESTTRSHGFLAPERNDITSSIPSEERNHKPGLLIRICRGITEHSKLFKSEDK
ncbi:hypothetical protein DPEC_G00272930 [Dallia pectoralis]|uniref:Uncharacterized protein n=1 Tax=Dallia pectoralis TaxID=75939 RepID=A0ACC2FQ44_DALPE|nr:hypothetical protein DPEC_G00272930 [Dallia pectoralis]